MSDNAERGHGMIGACSHNGSALATCFSAHISDRMNRMKIQGRGVKGFVVNRSTNDEVIASLTYVGGGLIEKGTKGTLVIHMIRGDGETIDTAQALGMVAFERSVDVEHGTGAHSAVKQDLEYEGDMATDPFTISFAS